HDLNKGRQAVPDHRTAVACGTAELSTRAGVSLGSRSGPPGTGIWGAVQWKPVGPGARPDERAALPKRDRDQMIDRLRAKLRSSRAESESLRVALREAEEAREQASPQLLAKLDDMRSQRDRLATERDHLLSLHTALAAETARLRTEY